MLSRFLSLFSFSFSFSNDEKSYIVMRTSKFIPGVIPEGAIDNEIQISQWEDKVVKSENDLCNRLDDLRGCRLKSVSHYRGKGNIPHELIVIEIWSGTDQRFMRLERLNKREDVETTIERSKRSKREFVGLHTGNFDRVKWTSTLDKAIQSRYYKKYQLVQILNFPLGFDAIGIIDVIALATAITSSAQNYSLFAHMCLWWAAIFFETFKRKAIDHEGVRFTEGPLYPERGNILKLNFVDANCKLLAPFLTVKAKETLGNDANRYSAQEIDQFQAAITKDSTDAGGDLAGDPVETMTKRWDTSGKELTATLQAVVDAAIARRDALDISNAKLVERDAQIAKQEQQIAAERVERVKLAEQNAKHEQQIAKHEQQIAELMAYIKASVASPPIAVHV
ncbi:hypothetical protein D9615_006958 [Tricholomella constricta]|uniref:Uncharacterized protein n=1 Tax=Tricholomella constricta TaxID=117010 RepID=A0A8H5M316_9AGAR|nr:hypothetical protein D9615_006958 [Tricholomella constricta]